MKRITKSFAITIATFNYVFVQLKYLAKRQFLLRKNFADPVC